jgi:hypothetical protein
MKFDWHGGLILRTTEIDSSYRSVAKNMDDVADEWKRRHELQ